MVDWNVIVDQNWVEEQILTNKCPQIKEKKYTECNQINEATSLHWRNAVKEKKKQVRKWKTNEHNLITVAPN